MASSLRGKVYHEGIVSDGVRLVKLIVVGVQPPNDIAQWIVGGCVLMLALLWWGYMARRFPGPPHVIYHLLRPEALPESPHRRI